MIATALIPLGRQLVKGLLMILSVVLSPSLAGISSPLVGILFST